MKKILIVLLITGLFILYLFQHHYSIKCTQEIAQLEKQKQLLQENIVRLETEKNKTFLFANLLTSAQQLRLKFPKRSITQIDSVTKKINNNLISVTTAQKPNE